MELERYVQIVVDHVMQLLSMATENGKVCGTPSLTLSMTLNKGYWETTEGMPTHLFAIELLNYTTTEGMPE